MLERKPRPRGWPAIAGGRGASGRAPQSSEANPRRSARDGRTDALSAYLRSPRHTARQRRADEPEPAQFCNPRPTRAEAEPRPTSLMTYIQPRRPRSASRPTMMLVQLGLSQHRSRDAGLRPSRGRINIKADPTETGRCHKSLGNRRRGHTAVRQSRAYPTRRVTIPTAGAKEPAKKATSPLNVPASPRTRFEQAEAGDVYCPTFHLRARRAGVMSVGCFCLGMKVAPTVNTTLDRLHACSWPARPSKGRARRLRVGDRLSRR